MKNIVILLIFCLSLMTITSCLKKQNLDDEDLGPAVQPLEVTKALGQAFGKYNYTDIKKNEFTSLMLSRRFQDSLVQNVEQQGITVDNVANSLEKLDLDLIVEDQTYSNGQTSQSTVKWPISIKKSDGANAAAEGSIHTASDAKLPILTFLMFESLAFGSCYDSGNFPETCHQLKVSDFQFKVPIAAANQHNCADSTNCFINARKVELDIVRKYQKDKDGKPNRTHYTVVISPEVPFLSRILQLCSRGIYDISDSGQKILADICYSVNNYAAGQNSAPPPSPAPTPSPAPVPTPPPKSPTP